MRPWLSRWTRAARMEPTLWTWTMPRRTGTPAAMTDGTAPRRRRRPMHHRTGSLNFMSLNRLIAILLIILFPVLSVAAPNPTGVSGTVSNGQSITVTGTGFGATGPNIRIFDDFETGTNGATIAT